MVRINIKPLSVNQAWRGKRYKTPAYNNYEKLVLMLLKPMKLPAPPYQIYFKFGFSSAASDWDNCVKPLQDCISKKYSFNDKLIKRGIVDVEMVKKGEEFFEFQIESLK